MKKRLFALFITMIMVLSLSTEMAFCAEVAEGDVSVATPIVKLSPSSCTYDGKAHKPKVKVYTADDKKIKSKYYKVKYPSGRKKIGNYNIKVTFKDNYKDYSGTIVQTFTVRPKTPKMKNFDKKAGNGFGLQWHLLKDESKIAGYEVQWADNKSFNDPNSLIIEKGYIGWNSSAMGLVNGTKYYCRIRSIAIKGDAAIYSFWSKSKSSTYTGSNQSAYDGGDTTLEGLKLQQKKSSASGKSSSGKSSGKNNSKHNRCSACSGTGHVLRNVPMSYSPVTGMMQYTMMMVNCSICGGRGWI